MFANLAIRPKRPRPAGSDAAPEAESEELPRDPTIQTQSSQSTSALACNSAVFTPTQTLADVSILSGSHLPSLGTSLKGDPTKRPPTPFPKLGPQTRRKYVKLDMSDFELLTPGARTRPDSATAGDPVAGDDSNEHEMFTDDKSDWYSSISLQAKSAVKHTTSARTGNNKNGSASSSGSGSGSGSGSHRTTRTTKLSYEKIYSVRATASGITKKTSLSAARGNNQAQRHRRKSLSTNGKFDSISISTWEAFANLRSKHDQSTDEKGEEDCNGLDKEALWHALSCIPGFLFPPLQKFLYDHHAWTTPSTAGDGEDDATYDAEDRIDSLNVDMPLGRRAQMLNRLAFVLASPCVKKICGNSVSRKRLPTLIKIVMEEPSRVWAAKAAAANRQLAFLKENNGSSSGIYLSYTPLAASLDCVLARRFNLSAIVPQTTPTHADVNAMSDSAASAATGDSSMETSTVMDGNALVMVMQDLLSILASARRLFEKKTSVAACQERPATTRDQQAVYKAFDTALTAVQRLQDVQRELNHYEATLNGEVTMEDDLIGSLQSALGAME